MRKVKKPAWPSPSLAKAEAPPWYIEGAFRNALRRVVCVLNQRKPFDACAGIDLGKSDEGVAAAFEGGDLDAQLIQFNIEGYDTYARSAQHHAEHHFYANAGFQPRQNRRVAVFKVPRVFLDWGYQNLRKPEPDPLLATDFPSGQNDPRYVLHCATNYLVKNFWHNFVHAGIQGIDQGNYGRFRGLAREDSDFQADHVANLLTLRSYGVPLHYQGRGGEPQGNRVSTIFIRNRCNQLFAMRARHREEDISAATDDERWADLEWRFCRGVANRVSTTLLVHHLAAPSIKVFLGGEARYSPKRGTRWRHGNVLLEVAGRRFASPFPAYVPDDEWRAFHSKAEISAERRRVMRRRRVAREEEIASWVRGEYGQIIKSDAAFRESLKLDLEALGTRINVNLL